MSGWGRWAVRYRDYAQDIYASGRLLLDMIDDLLRVQQSAPDPEGAASDYCHVGQLLETAAAAQTAAARARMIDLQVDCPADLPSLRAETRSLTLAISRIIAEAIHCAPMSAHLSLRADLADGALHIQALVEGGEGPASELPEETALVDPLENPYVSAQGGGQARADGLALTIARQIIETNGGRLKLRSSLSDTAGPLAEIVFPESLLRR